MSVALMSLALRQRIEDRTSKLVLIAFAEHADADGLSWPSVDLIAAEAQCSGRTVQRIVKRFLEVGLLQQCRKAHGRGHPVVYRVRPEAIGRAPEYWELREGQRAASHPVQEDSGEPPGEDPQGDLLSLKGDSLVSPITPDPEGPKGDKNSAMGDKSGLMGDVQVSPELEPYNHKEPAHAGTEVQGADVAPASPPGSRKSERPTNGYSGGQRSHQTRRRRSGSASSDRPSLQEVRQSAYQNNLPAQARTETESEFRQRMIRSLAMLATLDNSCRDLKIEARKIAETLEHYDRRVNDAILANAGPAEILTAEDARAQCRATLGLHD